MLQHRKSLPKSIKLVYSASSAEKSLLPLLPSTEGVTVLPVYSRLTYKDIQKLVGKPEAGKRTQVMVCGPEEYAGRCMLS